VLYFRLCFRFRFLLIFLLWVLLFWVLFCSRDFVDSSEWPAFTIRRPRYLKNCAFDTCLGIESTMPSWAIMLLWYYRLRVSLFFLLSVLN
jgi:hypothetical protein